MPITAYLVEKLTFFATSFPTGEKLLTFVCQQLEQHGYVTDALKLKALLIQREQMVSTVLENQIAIPHAYDACIQKPVVVYVQNQTPVSWFQTTTYQPQYFFFLLIPKQQASDLHISLLQSLATRFLDPTFVTKLKTTTDFASLVTLLASGSYAEQANDQPTKNEVSLVAVTACPTGIAHTFLAAESLKKAAEKLNIKIKVETQGANGPANVLSQQDIDKAAGVLLAIDKTISQTRFQNHPNVLEVSSKKAIHEPIVVLQQLLANQKPQLNTQHVSQKPVANSTQTTVTSFAAADQLAFQAGWKAMSQKLYKSVMNGVSYMLPYVIFGGIMIALGFLIDINNAGAANFGSVNPVAKWFNRLGGLAFGLIVPILCAYISYGLVGRFGLLPGFICGLIAQGQFLFALDPASGTVDFLGDPQASSGFFGAIAGAFWTGLLIYLFNQYVFGKLPASMVALKNILFIPLLGTFVIAGSFWIINIPFIYLNYGFAQLLNLINSNPFLIPLLTLIIGIMMSVDLGGPINKAAYLFALATLEDAAAVNGTIAMAASMAAGMVPPLGIAFAYTLGRKQFSKEQRQSAYPNYIMGLSFVSEGAIPFTAEKPKVFVPANIIGAAVTGLLVGAFQITLKAPHGGVFVFALVGSNLFSAPNLALGLGILLYVVTILVGTLVSALVILLLSKWTSGQKPLNKFVWKWPKWSAMRMAHKAKNTAFSTK